MPPRDVAPHAGHAAEAAGGVVEADGGGAGVEGAGVGSDDALAEVCDLQALVAEIVLDELGHGPVEEELRGLPDRRRGGLRSVRVWARRRSRDRLRRRAAARRAAGESTSLMAFQPSTSPGRSGGLRLRSVSSSSQSWMLEPSRKGTKRPLTAGVHWKPRRGRSSSSTTSGCSRPAR